MYLFFEKVMFCFAPFAYARQHEGVHFVDRAEE